ncbi:MAG: glycosyltransferase [Phycisphaerae bacterium]
MSVLQTASSFLSEAFHPPALRRDPRPRRGRDIACKLAIVGGAAAILWLTWLKNPIGEAAQILWYSPVGRVVATIGIAYGSLVTVWSFWRLWLAIRYHPVAPADEAALPTVTVVVPAYNEGALVRSTLHHLASADYPSDRIEIIVVDDGSDDDTWSHIKQAAREIGPRVRPIRCPTNRGKRWALWEGFRRGTGTVFVTVDSDSLIAPDALRAVVSPMAADARIGAVAGNVTVLNPDDGLIPKMLRVRYVMTFDYKRAAQSMMGGGAVLCCAGALAAYRRSAVMPILDQWLHQTFRGGPARAGEDHAMTNFILKQGYKTCYQRTARVRTQSPATYAGLAKMFLRWARSNIRETVHSGSFLFRAFRREPAGAIRFNFIMAALGQVLPYPFLLTALVLSLFLPMIFGLKLLASCVTASIFSVLFFAARQRDSDALFATPYSLYATILLFWVQPYALLTCNKSVWLTRTARRVAPPSPTPSAAVRAATPPSLDPRTAVLGVSPSLVPLAAARARAPFARRNRARTRGMAALRRRFGNPV